jgi:predicted metal-binding protein
MINERKDGSTIPQRSIVGKTRADLLAEKQRELERKVIIPVKRCGGCPARRREPEIPRES